MNTPSKVCTKCGKEHSILCFYPDGRCRGGYKPICNYCLIPDYEKLLLEYPGEAFYRCSTCKQWKPTSKYHKDSNSPKGVVQRCQVCVAEWCSDNSEHLVQKSMEWQKQNPERALEIAKKWREQNPDKVRENSKKSGAKTREKRRQDPQKLEHRREKMREYSRTWREKYPVKSKAKWHRRRARIVGNGGSYTQEEWEQLCTMYNHRCLCCGEQEPLTVDHVIPLSMGGVNNIQNIQPLCLTCNCAKGAKSIDYRT